MDLKTNWNVFSKNRDAIYGVAIISIIIFHFFEDVASSNISGGRFAGEIYNTFVGSVGVEFFIFLSGVGLYFSMTKDSRVRYFFSKEIKENFADISYGCRSILDCSGYCLQTKRMDSICSRHFFCYIFCTWNENFLVCLVYWACVFDLPGCL